MIQADPRPLSQQLRSNPLVALLIAGSLVGYFVATHMRPPAELFFLPPDKGQWWQSLSPIFLHFGIAHFAFNALWLLILGTRIESYSGALHLLLLVAVTGLLSNMAQYAWSGSRAFGGMSGVIYGLLGYLYVRGHLNKIAIYQLPNQLVGFMVGWMLLCMTGLPTLLLGSGIANAAHAGGLLAGVAVGLLFAAAPQRSGQD